MPLTKEDLREEAAKMRRQADLLDELAKLTPAQIREQAVELRSQAEALEGVAKILASGRLPLPSTSAKDLDVTQAQSLRRGGAIAKARAKHPIAKAIVESKWRSRARYAKARLKLSEGSLSNYISGKSPAPVEVMDKVRADFGLGDDAWPNPEKRRS